MARLKAELVRTGARRLLGNVPSANGTDNPERPPAAASMPAGSPRPAAQQEIEARLRAAFEKARDEGLAEGQASARSAFQERIQAAERKLEQQRSALRHKDAERQAALQSMLEQLRDEQQRLLADAEGFAVELALRALARLLPLRDADAPVLAESCALAVQELGGSALRVRVAPAVADGLRTRLRTGIELVVDPALRADQCFIETPRGDVETGLATRLAGITDALLAALREPSVRGA